MRTYLPCRYRFVAAVQNKLPTSMLDLDFVADLPGSRIVACYRFVSDHVVLVIPLECDVVDGIAVEDRSAPFPVRDAPLRVLLEGEHLRRLRPAFSNGRDEGRHQHCDKQYLGHDEAHDAPEGSSRQARICL